MVNVAIVESGRRLELRCKFPFHYDGDSMQLCCRGMVRCPQSAAIVARSRRKSKCHAYYFKMINERGGINGRKVNLISLDDGYAPPETV